MRQLTPNVDHVAWSKRTGFKVLLSAAPASQSVRAIQNFHVDTHSWSNIGYNFLVNSITGTVCEGRGWTVLGARCNDHNIPNISVCVIGKDHAGVQDVSDAAHRAFKQPHEEANDSKGGKLALLGHHDRGWTDSPRRRTVRLGSRWPSNRRHVTAHTTGWKARPRSRRRDSAARRLLLRAC